MTADQKSGELSGRRKFLGLTTSSVASTWAGRSLFAAGASAAPGSNDTINLTGKDEGTGVFSVIPCAFAGDDADEADSLSLSAG